MNSKTNTPLAAPEATPPRFASFLYGARWLFTALMIALIIGAVSSAGDRLTWFSSTVAGLGGDLEATKDAPPLVFDPSMDLWYGEGDLAVNTWYEIEDRFVAEDYVIIGIEADQDEFGAFSRDSMSTIARLTDQLLAVPGVRHVRSLTYNPWIRWGEIEDEFGSEEGLIISDLVEGDPNDLSDSDIIERMVAILGAERTAARVGEERVREVIGAEENFADHIGEPLLLGTIVNETGDTSVIQVQILRPRVDQELLTSTFADDAGALRVAPTLYSVSAQRKSLNGIEQVLRMEQGLALPSEQYAGLLEHIASITDPDARLAAELELKDPRFNHMAGADAVPVPKFIQYDRIDGELIDINSGDPAPQGFKPQARSPYEYHIAGSPLFERNFEVVGMADAKYIPLMFLVIILVLFAVFRNIAGVVVPLAVVFGSIMAMVGVNLAMGDLMNNLTMMSPNMLTAVGIADAIHLVAAWFALRHQYDNKRDLIIEVMNRNALPVFLTSLTTAVGFYSLTVSHLVPVQMLGAMASFGTLMAYLLSMTIVPALLSLVPHRQMKGETKPSKIALIFTPQRSAAFIGRIIAHRGKILVTSFVLLLVSIFGMTRIEIDSDFRSMFPDTNPTMAAYVWVESRMGGVGDLELVFSGAEAQAEEQAEPLDADQEARLESFRLRSFGNAQYPDELAALSTTEEAEFKVLDTQQVAWEARRIGVSTEFLGTLGKFEQRLREEMADPDSELAIVTDFISPLDTLRKINQVQNENRASAYRVPTDADVSPEQRQPELFYDEWSEDWTMIPAQTGQNLIAQYYLQYESGARPGESLTTQLSATRTHFRVQGRIQQATSMVQLDAIERIQEIAIEEFPSIAGTLGSPSEREGDLADLTLSGKTLLFARTSQLFATGFMESMGIALFAITLLIAFVFRSLRLAVISLIPNLLPIIFPLSLFGLVGVPLDGPAILVSSVALGVCVDDTIHFFTKYVRGRRAGYSPEIALQQTVHQSGAAMTVTTVVLVIGFGTLLLSDFSPNFQMGALAGVMIALAWLFDFVVTAAVLSYAGSYAVQTQEPLRAEPSPA